MHPSMVPHVARRLMELHGLWQAGWRLQLDSAKRRAGLCRHGPKVISLGRHYIELNSVDHEDDIVDTILHEIAHALVGPGHGHDEVWKEMCRRVGANPVRCLDGSIIKMPKGRLAATCRGCGRTYRRHKRIRAGSFAYCTKCGKDVGLLVFVDTETGPPTSLFPPSTDVPPPPSTLR